MAIGTTAAILGAAAIGAGAGILGSSKQAKATNNAIQAQNAAAQLQYDLGQQSLALNQSIYNSNYNTLSPFVSRGNVAGDSLNALLGLPAAPRMTSPLAAAPATSGAATASQPNPLASEWSRIRGYIGDGISDNFDPAAIAFIRANESRIPTTYTGPSLSQIQNLYHNGVSGDAQAALSRLGSAIASAPVPAAPATPPSTPAAPATPAVTPQTAQQAFNQFKNSAGFNFAMDSMSDALNNRYAAGGALQSGAAMKAMQQRANDVAVQGYFLPYMSLLSGQQGVGAGAASSIAGVGANFGNTAASINNSMGNAAANNANALGNLYAAQGQNSANMWNNLGSSFGTALGALSGGGGFRGSGGITVNNPYLPMGF